MRLLRQHSPGRLHPEPLRVPRPWLALGLLLLATSMAALPSAAETGSQPPRVYVAFVEEGPKLDGVLDDPVWQQAEPITDFTQVEPVQLGAPSYRTEVRFVSDEDALYISFRAYDPHPSQIVANLMERDSFLFFDDNTNEVPSHPSHPRRLGQILAQTR